MADATRGKRPLSPHLTIYRPYMSMLMSITHRITGVGMALAAVLTVWWFLAAATGPEYFDFVDGLVTSWIGGLIMLGSLVALWYHFCNGIRHLLWDTGTGFELDKVRTTGLISLAATAGLTVITLFFVW